MQVVSEQGHAQRVEERKSLGLEAVALVGAVQRTVFEFALVASAGLVIEVHVLGDRHEHAFVALDPVSGLYLGAREDGDGDGRNQGGKGDGLFGKDSLQPFPEILVQGDKQGDSRHQLHHKEGEGQVQVQNADGVLVAHVRAQVDKEGNSQGYNEPDNSCGV